MKISKTMLLCGTYLLISSQSYADDFTKPQFGIGVAIDSDIQKIYAPITMGSFILEPTFTVEDSENEGLDQSVSGTVMTETTLREFGVGAFHFNNPNDKTRIYYGARMGRMNLETETGFSGGPHSGDSFSRDSHGYFFAPTIGFEYFVMPNVSFGGEVQGRYSSIELDRTDNNDKFETDGKFVVRFHF